MFRPAAQHDRPKLNTLSTAKSCDSLISRPQNAIPKCMRRFKTDIVLAGEAPVILEGTSFNLALEFLSKAAKLPDGKRPLCLFCESEFPVQIGDHWNWHVVTTVPVNGKGKKIAGQGMANCICPRCARVNRDDLLSKVSGPSDTMIFITTAVLGLAATLIGRGIF